MAYTDLTAVFEPKLRIDWQEFDELAGNDDFKHLDSSTAMVFFQAAAPIGWTKQAVQNDKALRVVTGAGGGSGGSKSISESITLAHTHTIDSHNHTFTAHLHPVSYELTGTPLSPPIGDELVSDNSNGTFLEYGTAGSDVSRYNYYNQTKTDGSGTTGNNTDTTNSQLSNTTLAYVDMIVCEKD